MSRTRTIRYNEHYKDVKIFDGFYSVPVDDDKLCITETECVYWAVGAESLNRIQVKITL